NAPHVSAETNAYPVESENYLQTQVDIIQSPAVLSRAVKSLGDRAAKSFALSNEDWVQWLRKSGLFNVEMVKKSNLIDVTMQTVDPHEAAAVVQAVLDAYIGQQLEQRQHTSEEMLTALRQEKHQIDTDH